MNDYADLLRERLLRPVKLGYRGRLTRAFEGSKGMITINGWSSYQAWVEAGCPGAVSFDAQGNRKDKPATYLLPPPKRCACGVIIRDASFDQCAVCRPRVSRQLPCSFAGCKGRVVSRDLCYLHLGTMQARERLRASGSLR